MTYVDVRRQEMEDVGVIIGYQGVLFIVMGVLYTILCYSGVTSLLAAILTFMVGFVFVSAVTFGFAGGALCNILLALVLMVGVELGGRGLLGISPSVLVSGVFIAFMGMHVWGTYCFSGEVDIRPRYRLGTLACSFIFPIILYGLFSTV